MAHHFLQARDPEIPPQHWEELLRSRSYGKLKVLHASSLDPAIVMLHHSGKDALRGASESCFCFAINTSTSQALPSAC